MGMSHSTRLVDDVGAERYRIDITLPANGHTFRHLLIGLTRKDIILGRSKTAFTANRIVEQEISEIN